MSVRILIGDWRDQLASLDVECCQTMVSSPPYYGLRDYGVAGQLGLEESPEEYVAKIVGGMQDVRRALAGDGTAWLNLGDSYANDTKWGGAPGGKHVKALHGATGVGRGRKRTGLKAKDLIGIPWAVAFALRSDGWYLRSDIVWGKPNGMPESVKDRPVRSHEYVFLLSKSPRYFFDWKAVRRPLAASSIARLEQPTLEQQQGSQRANGSTRADRPMKAVKFGGEKRMGGSGGGLHRERERERERENSAAIGRDRGTNGVREGTLIKGANLRDVWWIATQPFAEAHFAVMPPKLAETCILAGSRPGDTVLDPFFGAGTVGLVADRLGRNCIGIELNPEYAALARRRITADAPLFAGEGG
jgi:DNA modification methylase